MTDRLAEIRRQRDREGEIDIPNQNWLIAEVERLRVWKDSLLALTAEQAEDDVLWAHADYTSEAYIQQELRRLTELVEGKTATECARAVLD